MITSTTTKTEERSHNLLDRVRVAEPTPQLPAVIDPPNSGARLSIGLAGKAVNTGLAVAAVAVIGGFAARNPGGEATFYTAQDGERIEIRLKTQPQADLDRATPNGPYWQWNSQSYIERTATSADMIPGAFLKR